jgi:hypothetical protein
MSLDLSTINEQVNSNLAAPVATAEPTADYYKNQLAEANARITALEAENVEAGEALAAVRLKAIGDNAKKPLQPVGSGKMDLAYDLALRKIGNAKFHQLSDADRCKLLGVEDASQITNEQCGKYFGRGSSSSDAAQLQRTNPSFYAKLRAVSKARGIM